VAQQMADGRVAPQDGQLAIRKGALSAQRVVISGAATAAGVSARLAMPDDRTLDPRLRWALTQLSESLRVFAATRYSRRSDVDGAALDAGLDSAIEALRRLYEMQQWRTRTIDAASRAVERMKAVWAR
jgi:hypothetical protein